MCVGRRDGVNIMSDDSCIRINVNAVNLHGDLRDSKQKLCQLKSELIIQSGAGAQIIPMASRSECPRMRSKRSVCFFSSLTQTHFQYQRAGVLGDHSGRSSYKYLWRHCPQDAINDKGICGAAKQWKEQPWLQFEE